MIDDGRRCFVSGLRSHSRIRFVSRHSSFVQHRIAQGSAKPVEDRRPQQEVLHLGGLVRQNFDDQVLCDEPGAIALKAIKDGGVVFSPV